RWQCSECTVSFCKIHLPHQLATAGRKARVAGANSCMHCRSPSPMVKLALVLEVMCSRVLNNHQAVPFLRPFLPGIATTEEGAPAGAVTDMLGLLEKTRRLGYSSSAQLQADMESLRDRCRRTMAAR
ncbi:unnamed protein product, partial [Discosporangium mesarthrocarpum]